MLDFHTSNFYKRYTALKEFLQSGITEQVYLFDQFFYKTTYTHGTCPLWEHYLQSNMNPPFEGLYFSEVHGFFADEGVLPHKPLGTRAFNASCVEPAAVSQIRAALARREGTTNVLCNGHKWRMYECRGQMAVCVDCAKVCTACPGEDSALINPCGRTAMGCGRSERAAFAFLRFHLDKKILYPEIVSPLVIEPGKHYLDVTISTNRDGAIFCAALRPTRTLALAVEIKGEGVVIEVTANTN